MPSIFCRKRPSAPAFDAAHFGVEVAFSGSSRAIISTKCAPTQLFRSARNNVSSGNTSAKRIMRKRLRLLNTPAILGKVNCRDSVETICLPYSARCSCRTSSPDSPADVPIQRNHRGVHCTGDLLPGCLDQSSNVGHKPIVDGGQSTARHDLRSSGLSVGAISSSLAHGYRAIQTPDRVQERSLSSRLRQSARRLCHAKIALYCHAPLAYFARHQESNATPGSNFQSKNYSHDQRVARHNSRTSGWPPNAANPEPATMKVRKNTQNIQI